jgi:oligoribonuclease (3'-5' exoribonuclease)
MMYYNVTVQVESDIEQDWLDWMQDIHIPEVMATGIFSSCSMCRLVSESVPGTTFVMQYQCPDLQTLEQYQQRYAPALQKAHNDRYQGKFVAFRTIMTRLHEW